MATKLLGIVSAVVIVSLEATAAYAGVAPSSLCKDKKGKATGVKTLGLLKAFGSNVKTPNSGKLAAAISKAQSKFTKGFTKAEFSGAGASKGCETIEDAGDIEAKVDAFVTDVLDDLSPAPPTTTSTTTSSTTSTTVSLCATLRFTTGLPGGACGRINDDVAGTGTDLTPYGGSGTQLDCGSLYIGGGGSVQPPSPTPDGASTVYGVSDCSVATAMVLAPTASSQTGSNRNCTAPGCFFGPPLPIPNVGSTATSTCVLNSIAPSPAVGGSLNAIAGSTIITLPLRVGVGVTGDLEPAPGIQPCPRCVGGACTSGPNSGGTCSSPTSLLTSYDCPPPGATLAPFLVDLSPLNTSSYYLSAAGGAFCPSQAAAGCFGSGSCEYIGENGSPAGDLTGGGALAQTLASVYCIPKTGNPLVNTVASLPGPGAVTLKGSAELLP
jgi:hypothetical protein